MTRLLKAQKQNMLEDIMGAIPQIDYAAKIKAAVLAEAVRRLPEDAARLWNDPRMRGLLNMNGVYIYPEGGDYRYIISVSVPGHRDESENLIKLVSIQHLIRAHSEQARVNAELRTKLKNAFYVINTHEEFARQYPDLKEYLPESSPAVPANLPATTEVMDRLRVAGLPIPKKVKKA